MIEIRNLSFQYPAGQQQSLNSISLHISNGECVLVCGESGCGKSTLLKTINGLIPHYYEEGQLEGAVYSCGLNVAATLLEKISEKTGSVFQNPRSQFFCVDTTGELAFGCENQGMPKEEIERRIQQVVRTMALESLMDRNIFALSGGEKQKIACASVSVMQPEVLVLDEPTSNLDYVGIDVLKRILRLWKSEGRTIVVAEHRLGWLKGIADRVVILKDGVVSAQIDGNSFFEKNTEELNTLGLRALEARRCFTDYPKGFYSIADLEKEAMHDGSPELDNGESFVLSGFRYAYRKGIDALDLEDFSVPKHAVVAVIGHNGAGKSTFSKCLCGLMKGFKGTVSDQNRKVSGRKLNGLCFMVMQDVNHQLFTESCLEEMLIGMEHEDKDTALEVLRKMDLAEYSDRHPMSLSGGQKQRLAICQAYLSDRDIIIFDEPTSGLDYKHMKKTAELIREISKDKTVFIVTHDMELVEECCTHVLNMG